MAEIVEPIEGYGLSKKDKKRSLMSKIGVVGCGREGRDIVRLIAMAGIEVTFIEVDNNRIQKALTSISESLDTEIDNWGLTESEKRATISRIKGSLDYKDLKDCDLVIECIRYEENGERSTALRKDVFKALEKVLSTEAIIATNSTTVIISELAANLKYKDRCVTLHFPISHVDARLLEIVGGAFTSQEIIDKICLFARLLKYTPVLVKESNGQVSLRLMVTMLNEACEILMEGVASMEDIDKEFVIVYGQRFGIFELADIVGIEKLVMLMEDMFAEFGDKKYKASPVLWRLYRSKQIGVEAKRGFYIYDENEKKISVNHLI